MDDNDEHVRAAAIRLSEHHFGGLRHDALIERLNRAAGDASESVRLQAALTLGALHHAQAMPLLVQLVRENEHPLFRAAAVTGLGGKELEFLKSLLGEPAWLQTTNEHRSRVVELLAQCVTHEGNAPRVVELLGLVEKFVVAPAWLRDALLEGIESAGRKTPIELANEPAVLTRLASDSDVRLRQTAFRLQTIFTWPGAAPLATGASAPPLSPEQQKLVEAGREPFTQLCAPCHQLHGGGNPNVAPPLAESDWVAGPPERLVRIALHGLYGPVQVNGHTWNLHMPGLGETGVLSDEKLAAILSYVRRSWANAASPVQPGLVEKVRRKVGERTLPWTAAELAEVDGVAPATTAASGAPVIKPTSTGELLLPASQAATYGQKLAYRPSLDILAPWRLEHDVAEWRVEVSVSQTFDVWVTLAADDASAGDYFLVETEGSHARGTVPSTGGYDRFREHPCGRLVLRPGLNRILMRPDGPLKQELADVRALRLVPVR